MCVWGGGLACGSHFFTCHGQTQTLSAIFISLICPLPLQDLTIHNLFKNAYSLSLFVSHLRFKALCQKRKSHLSFFLLLLLF